MENVKEELRAGCRLRIAALGAGRRWGLLQESQTPSVPWTLRSMRFRKKERSLLWPPGVPIRERFL